MMSKLPCTFKRWQLASTPDSSLLTATRPDVKPFWPFSPCRMQRGIKQASDAYARVAASIGSLERIVELHDRGVFKDAAHTLGIEELPVRGRWCMHSCCRTCCWAG